MWYCQLSQWWCDASSIERDWRSSGGDSEWWYFPVSHFQTVDNEFHDSTLMQHVRLFRRVSVLFSSPEIRWFTTQPHMGKFVQPLKIVVLLNIILFNQFLVMMPLFTRIQYTRHSDYLTHIYFKKSKNKKAFVRLVTLCRTHVFNLQTNKHKIKVYRTLWCPLIMWLCKWYSSNI